MDLTIFTSACSLGCQQESIHNDMRQHLHLIAIGPSFSLRASYLNFWLASSFDMLLSKRDPPCDLIASCSTVVNYFIDYVFLVNRCGRRGGETIRERHKLLPTFDSATFFWQMDSRGNAVGAYKLFYTICRRTKLNFSVKLTTDVSYHNSAVIHENIIDPDDVIFRNDCFFWAQWKKIVRWLLSMRLVLLTISRWPAPSLNCCWANSALKPRKYPREGYIISAKGEAGETVYRLSRLEKTDYFETTSHCCSNLNS